MSNEPCKREVTLLLRCNVLDKVSEIAAGRGITPDQLVQEILGQALFAAIDEEANK
jgi:hypothetical protein